MKVLTVFFETNAIDMLAAAYIDLQEPWQQAQLRAYVTELETTHTIRGSDVHSLGDERWFLWVMAAGYESERHTCYLATEPRVKSSAMARLLANPDSAAKPPPPSTWRELVIESGLGTFDSIGGRHDGYYTLDHYAAMIDAVKMTLLTEAIDAIKSRRWSPSYRALLGERFHIKIDRPDVAYGVHIDCIARWETMKR